MKAFKRRAKDGSIVDADCEGLKEMTEDVGEGGEEAP